MDAYPGLAGRVEDGPEAIFGHRPVRAWCASAQTKISARVSRGAARWLRFPRRRDSSCVTVSPPVEHGKVDNDPVEVKAVRCGSKRTVSRDELNDWI
jgi:hypothetical protein